MLKHIPTILSPELVKYLMEMGHGDEVIIADANFPAHRIGQRVVRCDGHGVPVLLDAILTVLPLDTYSDYQAGLMQVVPGDPTVPVIWDEYKALLEKHHPAATIKEFERFAFYEQAEKAYLVIQTGEGALYGNIILKKVSLPANEKTGKRWTRLLLKRSVLVPHLYLELSLLFLSNNLLKKSQKSCKKQIFAVSLY